MYIKNNLVKTALFAIALGIAGAGCQKMERPELGDYPKDTNPPGGPLKFYTAFENTNVDSMRANFGVNTNITYMDGITGKGIQAPANGYVVYGSANDFKNSQSFTVAFWMKKNGPNAAGGGTNFAFGTSTTEGFWHQMSMFMLFEDAGNPSSSDLAAVKFSVQDQWYEFVGAKRIPNLLNNQWHHLAITFDQTNSTFSFYMDGAPFNIPGGLPANFGKFTNNGGVMNLTKMGGLVVGGPGHWAAGKTPDSWMGNFNGQIDQFRLYGTALTAAEVNSLYTGKK